MSRSMSPAGRIEQVGSVSCPSGVLLVLDGGLARIWSHDRPPELPAWHAAAEKANSALDLEIRGPDALAAGLAFDCSRHPLYLYDRPGEALQDLQLASRNLVRERKLDASLEVLPERVPHRRRVDLAMAHGGGAGAVQFYGLSAVAVGGVPRDRLLPILGEWMPSGPYMGCWRRVSIELRDGVVANTRSIGDVFVEAARFMAVDADALGAWDDDKTQDGEADIVFWGRDAALVAEELGAPAVEDGGQSDVLGWTNLPLDDALDLARRIDAIHAGERKFAFDFRPHTHHWQVMRDVRATSTQSGVLDLAGARLCMFMTTWGDGAFPVEIDRDAAGQILRVRIEVGCKEIVDRQRALEKEWFGEEADRS
jgi:hypothetical protein